MKNTNKSRTIWIVAATVAVAGAIAWSLQDDRAESAARAASATSTAAGPELQLPFAAMAGKQAYDADCAQCHGSNGAGTDKGPPFVHEVYNPGHHPDAAFARAVAQGVRQHHWRFGDMPAQPQVTGAQSKAIVTYVRAVQEARGITFQPHKM